MNECSWNNGMAHAKRPNYDRRHQINQYLVRLTDQVHKLGTYT